MEPVEWILLIAAVGASGLFVKASGDAIQQTANAAQDTMTTATNSTVTLVIVVAGALWLMHETGVLKGGIKI
jgi:hypothetical protein